MFNKITNPINNKSYSIYSTQGKNLLKSYVSLLNKKQLGGGVNVRGIEDANELQEGNFWLRVTGNVAGRHYSRIIQVLFLKIIIKMVFNTYKIFYKV